MGIRQQRENQAGEYGTLYVVSTPIGNLEDMTLRALRILKTVDVIAAESVTHSMGLCRHYDIHTKLVSYNQHNQNVKGPVLISKLKAGKHIALVTNAGTPGVSDPGVMLAAQALKENIRVSPVPGPSSVTAALSVSGLRGDKFLFLGFLSPKPGKRRKELGTLVSENRTMVFFEAPHRLRDMLADLRETLGNRRIVIVREMTKVYEEAIGSSTAEILDRLEEDHIKGEFTLVVSGREGSKEDRRPHLTEETEMRIRNLLSEKALSLRDIAERISSEEDLSYRTAYRACLSLKKGGGRKGERPEEKDRGTGRPCSKYGIEKDSEN